MAYRFDNSDDRVAFDVAPLVGYSAGAVTVAYILKPNSALSWQTHVGVMLSAGGTRFFTRRNGDDNRLGYEHVSTTINSTSVTVGDTSKWYIIAVTGNGSGSTPRFHVHNGTAWTHDNGTTTITSNTTISSGDVIRVGTPSPFNPTHADVVCAGIDKANHSDAEIEALTLTSFASWQAFGFDWLVGFETSGTVTDQGAAGTGDETSRIGTTLVSDPAGWSWAAAATTVVTRNISLVL